MNYKTLSIIIPSYNEKKTLLTVINRIKKQKTFNLRKEIIIVDDGSTDGTKKILKRLKGCKIQFHKRNKGKGAAIITGLRSATGNIILIQDADLEYNPNEYPRLLSPILKNSCQIVYGSRFKSRKGHLRDNHLTYTLHAIGNNFLTHITNLLYFANLTDMETCYKVFTRETLNQIGTLKAKGFDFEPEITAKFLKKGLKIKEIEIDYYSRDFNDGKKITWKDGIKAFFVLIKFRFLN
ncbi:MAG: glycosyltransferase family 2 protein [Nanoarchaeota archaeon]|nr:glycosyltransferase family 2 protein [Nanoarchaeota archaeon]